MSFNPYPEEEVIKSKLLLQASLLRSEGKEVLAASLFAEAAVLEERLAERAEADGDTTRAIRSNFSAASAWANAGDFHHALTLLQSLELRDDAPETLKVRVRAFSDTLRFQLKRWHESLQESSLV